MEKIYHDPNDPQLEAVERYAKYFPHSCCRPPEKTFHIFIFRNQLVSDFEFSLNIMTRSRRNETNNQDNTLEDTDKFQPMVNRWIDKYVSLAKARMGKSVVEPKQSADSAVASQNNEIDIELSIGDWWNDNMLSMLTQAIHDYIANGLMYEYLLLSTTEKDPDTQSKLSLLEKAYDDIKRLITAYKPGSIRKSYHPFP